MSCSPELIFSPGVHIASASYAESGVNEFLRSQNIEGWESDADMSGDYLPEVAGRLCYLSFTAPRPGGNKVYLDHIKEMAHGSVLEHTAIGLIFTGVSRSLTHELVRHRAGMSYCLAGDVEVFSGSRHKGRFNGVKKRWSLQRLYEMSLDPQRKGRIKLMKVRCYDGHYFVPAGIKAVTCSGEKDIYKVTLVDGKTIRSSADHRFLTPAGWKSVSALSVGDVMGTNGKPALGIDREWLEKRYHQDGALLAEIAGDLGCSPHTVRKYLKVYGLQKAQGQGMIGRSPPNKGTRYTTGYKHTSATKKLLREQKLGENNPHWKGDEASAQAGRYRAIKLFLKEPCTECGNPEGHRHHIDRNTKNNVPENIEFLCNHCHTLRHVHEDGPTHILTVKWQAIASIEPDGREMTYDLEIDHPAHNFVANGIVTHNSQLSQRYVDEGDTRFVVPPSYVDDVKGLTPRGLIWLNSVRHALSDYKTLVAASMPATMADMPQEQRTGIRKAVREAARSVLPNCTETFIYVTGNGRSWRHFLEMRGSLGADAEIRRLALTVLPKLQEVAPNLFSDYEVDRTAGVEHIQTPWRKV